MSTYCRVNFPTWKKVHGCRGRIDTVGQLTVKVFVIGPNFYAILRKDQIEYEDNNTQRGDNRTYDPNGAPKLDVRDSCDLQTFRFIIGGLERRLTALEHRLDSRPKRKRKDAITK